MNKRWFILLGVCLFFTLGNLYLHTAPFSNTMINYTDQNHPNTENSCLTDGFTPWAVNYHNTLPDFKKRPFTSLLVGIVSNTFSLRVSVAFVWVNYFFLFFSGFLVYYLSLLYLNTSWKALVSVCFYYTSFSVLLAYFIPIATYDEPIQYFLILASLLALKKEQLMVFALLFSLAVIARENSLLMLPGILFFLTGFHLKTLWIDKLTSIKYLLACSFPVVVYAVYLSWFFAANPEAIHQTTDTLSRKFSIYQQNFQDAEHISRTLLSFVSVTLLPLFLILYHRFKVSRTRFHQKMFSAFWLTFFINTPIIFLTVFAEESRVFYLPFLFLVPVAGKLITDVISFSPEFLKYLLSYKRLLLIVVIVTFSWWFFQYLYTFTHLPMNENLYREYHVGGCIFIGLILMYQNYLKKKGA